MTAQIPEKLRYKEEDVEMCTTPLYDYFALGIRRPRFESGCTALWRGYVGSWEIAHERLYLVALYGVLEDGTQATLETLFPHASNRVFAYWYSGTLRVPQGKRLEYVHLGYESTYERDLLLDIERGVLVATAERTNTTGR